MQNNTLEMQRKDRSLYKRKKEVKCEKKNKVKNASRVKLITEVDSDSLSCGPPCY